MRQNIISDAFQILSNDLYFEDKFLKRKSNLDLVFGMSSVMFCRVIGVRISRVLAAAEHVAILKIDKNNITKIKLRALKLSKNRWKLNYSTSFESVAIVTKKVK